MQQNLKELNLAGEPLYIVPEREIEGFDHFGPGISLGHAGAKTLDALCRTLGVRSISSFYSQDTDALRGHLRYEGYSLPDLPAVTWFSAGAGLKTVRALAEYLESEPDALDDAKTAIEELREYETVLERFDKEGIRWYMSAGF